MLSKTNYAHHWLFPGFGNARGDDQANTRRKLGMCQVQ